MTNVPLVTNVDPNALPSEFNTLIEQINTNITATYAGLTSIMSVGGTFYPLRGTGNDTLAIQTALNLAKAAGGGVVDLGNFIWNLTSSVTTLTIYNGSTNVNYNCGLILDCSTTSIVGRNAYINCSAIPSGDYAIAVTNQYTNTYGYVTGSILGVTLDGGGMFVGTANGPNGILFAGTGIGAQAQSSTTLRNVYIRNFYRGIEFENYAYIIGFDELSITQCQCGLYSGSSPIDAGENIHWKGGCISNGLAGFVLLDMEVVFECVSFDYNMIFGAAHYCNLTFIGCHFEQYYFYQNGTLTSPGTAPSGSPPVQVLTLTGTIINPPLDWMNLVTSNGKQGLINILSNTGGPNSNGTFYPFTTTVAGSINLTQGWTLNSGSYTFEYAIPPFDFGLGTYTFIGGEWAIQNGAASGPVAQYFFGNSIQAAATSRAIKITNPQGWNGNTDVPGTNVLVTGILGMFDNSTSYTLSGCQGAGNNILPTSGTITPQAQLSSIFSIAMSGATTINGPINGYNGQKITIFASCGATAYTPALSTSSTPPFNLMGSSVPTLTANQTCQIEATYDGVSGKWRCDVIKAAAT